MSAESAVVPDQFTPSTEAEPVRKTRLQRLRWPLISLAAAAVLGGGTYFYIKGSRYQSTDDAYAQAATVSISANWWLSPPRCLAHWPRPKAYRRAASRLR
jgi:hypothetical protein